MVDTLSKLFGSAAKVKIIRLFIFNPELAFTNEDIMKRTSLSIATVRREVNGLVRAEFIRKKIFYREVQKKKRGVMVTSKDKLNGFVIDPKFPYVAPLKSMLIDSAPMQGDVLIRRFARAGKMKLIIVAGIFIHSNESRLDILVVGDRVNKVVVDRVVRSLETEIGKELRYAVFETPDFNYRLSVYDKLLRDVFDYPHEKVLDRLQGE